MFTAWGSQTPFRQIGHKGSKKKTHMQEIWENISFYE